MPQEETNDNSLMAATKEMTDITSILQMAAKSLKVSDPMLCNNDSFNLQDSMAALEMMDKKMDCCELPASLVAPFGVKASEDKMVFPRPAPTGLQDAVEPLPWNDLTIQDAAYISLETLVRFESLLSGASVVESTFTCLYAHRPVIADMKAQLQPTPESLTEQLQSIMKPKRSGTIAQNVVYASTLILLELTDVVRSIILNADIYEEEDFSVSTYNIAVFDDRDEATAIEAVVDALEMVGSLDGQDSDEIRVITLILGYQLDFLTVCTSMARLAGKTVRKVVEESQLLAKAAGDRLVEILRLSKKLNETMPDSIRALLRKNFDSYVNRPLVGNAPVRKIIFREIEESIQVLTTITNELDWGLCTLLQRGNTLSRIRRMLGRISTSSANILTRSLIVLNLYFDDKMFGQYSLPDMIVQHMRQMSHVPESLFSTKHSQTFLHRLAKPIYDTLKVLILNRNRQRAYIEGVMFNDWSSLQQEAHIVDVTYRKEYALDVTSPPQFSLYILYITVDLMDHFVTLGIELQLFCEQDELASAYWYRDFLLSSLLNQVSSMRRAKTAEAETAPSKASPRGKKKGGKNHAKKQLNNGNDEGTEDEFEFLMLGLKRGLCRGIVRFIAAINQAGLAEKTEYEFTSRDLIFRKRFEAFTSIQQPPPLCYEDFVQGSDFSKVAPNDLMTSTSECFNVSKTMVDKLLMMLPNIDPVYQPMNETELRQLAKVCVGNSVYVQKLRQIVDSKGKKKGAVSFDLETHPQFCTTKLT